MSCLCLSLFVYFWDLGQLIFRLSKNCSCNIMTKVTWQSIISWTGVLVVLGNWSPGSYRKFPG